jgi:DNA repair ATPase RecN
MGLYIGSKRIEGEREIYLVNNVLKVLQDSLYDLQDFRIEAMFFRTMRRLPVDEQDFSRIEKLLEKQTDRFQRYIGVVEENFQHKLNLVVEGQQMLVERMDRMEERLVNVETRLDRVEVKLDVVAADLSAHRKDTEAHGTVYRVKEEG